MRYTGALLYGGNKGLEYHKDQNQGTCFAFCQHKNEKSSYDSSDYNAGLIYGTGFILPLKALPVPYINKAAEG